MERRPDPDELLARVREEEQISARGKLTIFFGFAPGVGKTYTMLEAARGEAEDQKRDVAVGIVETHGRYDTGSLLIGLELQIRQVEGVLIDEVAVLLLALHALGADGDPFVPQQPLIALEGLPARRVLVGVAGHLMGDGIEGKGLGGVQQDQDEVGHPLQSIQPRCRHRAEPTTAGWLQ